MGTYYSSTRGPMQVSDDFRQLMKALRIATYEHKKEDSVDTATALSEARADIVAFVGKLERRLHPYAGMLVRGSFNLYPYQRETLARLMRDPRFRKPAPLTGMYAIFSQLRRAS